VKLERTGLEGLWVVTPEPHQDNRGLFARLYCQTEFAEAGIDFSPVQMSTSYNRVAGTLRGMHWQASPHGETKLLRATRGTVFDVAADLRDGSDTWGQWFGLEISAENRKSLLIPRGFAHGFLTLTDDAEVAYSIDTPFAPTTARGARFDDPALAISWPSAPMVISERDLAWPALQSPR